MQVLGSNQVGDLTSLCGIAEHYKRRKGIETFTTPPTTAQVFESYAMALDQASTGNGSFIALVCELLIVICAGFLVGFVVIAMFMPLIKLLNDLSIIVPGGLI